MNDIEDFSLETMLGKMEQMQDQIDKLQQEKAEKDTAILNQKSEMQKLLSKLDELRLTVQQLTAENTQMRSEMQDLLTSNENERKSNENRRHELKQKIERMQNETDHLLKLNKDQKAEVDHANWEIAEKDKKHKATENALENTITKWRTLFCVMSIVSFWLYGIAAHAMGW